MTADDLLPISMLNQLEYCERRFYLMHVLGEMEINAHVLEGSLRHDQAHSGRGEREGELLIHRRTQVWSDALGLSGFCDIVEELPEPGGTLLLTPVEYKKGRMGNWLNDHIQLCAQALCLEERLGVTIAQGFIFYFGSRRRQEVPFTPDLRRRTTQAVARARELIAANRLPPPIDQTAKCRDCSLEPTCLPHETRQLLNPAGPAAPRRGRPRA